jgi:hypothetical protein
LRGLSTCTLRRRPSINRHVLTATRTALLITPRGRDDLHAALAPSHSLRLCRVSGFCGSNPDRMRHLRRTVLILVASALALALGPQSAAAQRAGIAQFAGDPVAYDLFVKDAQPQRGLFTIWRKGGRVYIELAANQLEREFVQTIVPATGLGGFGVVWGNTDHLPTELVRFERAGNSVAILWPSPYFIAPRTPAAQRAIDRSFARSIVALAPIAAVDDRTGAVVIDAAPFLDDQLNLKNALRRLAGSSGRTQPYTLDLQRTYFGPTKAFPSNIVLEARQDWTSDDQRLRDVASDPRHVQIRVVYNIAEPPQNDGYRPRLADDRVGTYADVYLQFDDERVLSRSLRYVVRWNLQASDPTKPVSPATHPMVFYLSNTIPEKYRPAIREGVLKWNDAFLKIGISGALEVRDQPDDPNWDPDDIRYNVLRWIAEYRGSFGADSQTLFDPRTGEEFRTGILISADVPLNAQRAWTYLVDPVRYGRATDPMPQQFLDEKWYSDMLHETGHNLGFQHNFIGSLAYTAKQLQDKNFTSKFGITSTTMEYAPLNLWPRGTSQGDYYQTVLGPYDYYAVHWTYAPIPGAKTPEDELPTLRRWAAAWSDPRYRYASDEDVSWANGHAADPRVETGDLTNDALGWCAMRLAMYRDLMQHLNERFPLAGLDYGTETGAFTYLWREYLRCADLPAHFIGGQYLSRAHRGDPHAEPPIVPVSRAEQRRAFDQLDRNVFSADALRLPPSLLARLTYTEWAGYGYDFPTYGQLPQWAYDPPERHDTSLSDLVGNLQAGVLRQIFQPLVLARIVDGASETTDVRPMRLADLFDWMHRSVFRELASGANLATIHPLRRALQQRYLETLGDVAAATDPKMPADARALARSELPAISDQAVRALRGPKLDRTTRAHLEMLIASIHERLRPPASPSPGRVR